MNLHTCPVTHWISIQRQARCTIICKTKVIVACDLHWSEFVPLWVNTKPGEKKILTVDVTSGNWTITGLCDSVL